MTGWRRTFPTYRLSKSDLAQALGMSYAYGVEFFEMGLGDERERTWHAEKTISRLPRSQG